MSTARFAVGFCTRIRHVPVRALPFRGAPARSTSTTRWPETCAAAPATPDRRRGAQDVRLSRAARGEEALLAQLEALRRREPLVIERGAQRFFVPSNLAELAAMRAAHPGALLLAGGTDLGSGSPSSTRTSTRSSGRQGAELKRIDASATHLEIGAAATLTDAFERSPATTRAARAVPALRLAADPQRRDARRNIANALRSVIRCPLSWPCRRAWSCAGGAQPRAALDRFYLDYRKNALEPGEFLERNPRSAPRRGRTLRSYKLSKRLTRHFRGVRGVLPASRRGTCRRHPGRLRRDAAVPKRASHCEQALRGAAWARRRCAPPWQRSTGFQPDHRHARERGYRLSAAKNLSTVLPRDLRRRRCDPGHRNRRGR